MDHSGTYIQEDGKIFRAIKMGWGDEYHCTLLNGVYKTKFVSTDHMWLMLRHHMISLYPPLTPRHKLMGHEF